MRALHRTALHVALTLSPMLGAGCVQLPQQTTYTQGNRIGEATMNCARLEESRGHLNEAQQLYLKATRENPQNAAAYHRMGVIATQLNQHKEAERYYRKAYSLNSNNAELLADMGYSAFQRRDFEMAEGYLEQSVRLNGNDRRSIDNLAIARAWCGKDDSSLAAFRLVYGEAEATRRLNAIQVARGDINPPPAANLAAAEVVPPAPYADPFEGETEITAERYIPPQHKFADEPLSLTSLDAPPMQEIELFIPPSPEPLSTAQTENAEVIPLPSLAEETIMPPTIPELTTELPRPVTPLVVEESRPSKSAKSEKVAEAPKATVEIPTLEETANPIALIGDADSLQPSRKRVETAARTEPAKKFQNAMKPENAVAAEKQALRTLAQETAKLVDSDVGTLLNSIEWEAGGVCEANHPAPKKSIGEPQLNDTKSESKPSQITTWRKTPASRRATPIENGKSTIDPAIQQTSLGPESTKELKAAWGICLVTLAEENRLERGLPQYSTEYQSQRYRFSTEEAMRKFLESPKRYVPAAGGLDVVAVRNDRNAVQGSINFAICYRKQLYLFSTRENAEAFGKDPQTFIADQ